MTNQTGAAVMIRPGAGWKHLAGPVWEHANGTRIHTMGLVRLPDMTFLSATKWPECQEAAMFIQMNGGNKKRGLMAWATRQSLFNPLTK